MIPTFDEWFKQKNGASFEDTHQLPGALVIEVFKALSRAMRDYVTEINADRQQAQPGRL